MEILFILYMNLHRIYLSHLQYNINLDNNFHIKYIIEYHYMLLNYNKNNYYLVLNGNHNMFIYFQVPFYHLHNQSMEHMFILSYINQWHKLLYNQFIH